MKASKTLIRTSLLSRKSWRVISDAFRKTPSTFVTPSASVRLLVSLKGTRSGVSRVLPYKRQSEITKRAIKQPDQSDLLKETVEVDVDSITRVDIEKYIFKMSITQAKRQVNRGLPRSVYAAYPNIKPTMDMTANVRP